MLDLSIRSDEPPVLVMVMDWLEAVQVPDR